MESCIQSTQKDGMLTSDQALVKQAWDRLSARVRYRHTQTHVLYIQTRVCIHHRKQKKEMTLLL